METNVTAESIAIHLRKCLDESGLKQADISRKMDIDKQTVNKWFRTGHITKENMALLSRIMSRDIYNEIFKIRDEVADTYSNYVDWVEVVAYHIGVLQLSGIEVPPKLSAQWIAQCFMELKNLPVPANAFESELIRNKIKNIIKNSP